MGSHPDAVVNTELKVNGIQRLRVVQAAKITAWSGVAY